MGDKAAMKAVFTQNYGAVCAVVNRMLRDKALSEDIAQEVFIKFWNKKNSISIESSIPSYLKKMAINEAISHIRKYKNKTLEQIPEHLEFKDSINLEDDLIGKETKAEVILAIDQLPPKCRLVFQLSRFEELSYREIAEKLDISIKTVENQMSKALKTLRNSLKNHLT